MPTVDIKKKCPNSQTGSTGPCKDYKLIQAKKGNLPGSAVNYGYVTHSGLSGPTIKEITYDGRSLEIEYGKNGNKITSFPKVHPGLKEVTTYYYTKNDGDNDHINVPLILRVNGGEAYHLYLNKGDDGGNIKWRWIPLRNNLVIPSGDGTTQELTNTLVVQTCRLHRLHKIDVRNVNSDGNLYICPACGKARLWSDAEKHMKSIDCYKRFCHTLLDDGNGKVTYPVTHGNDPVSYQEHNGKIWKLLSVSKKDCTSLSVYYWIGDEHLDNPLLIEVKLTNVGQSEWYENIGDYGGKHDRWRKLEPGETASFSNYGQELEKKLDLLSCIFNGAVRINLGIDSVCHNSPDPRHNNRISTHHDGTVNKHLSISAYIYKHNKIYENKPFSVAELLVQDARQTFSDNTTFLKNVKRLIAYASSCDVENPFLLCIETESNDNKYQWYWKKDKGKKWEERSALKDRDPDNAKDEIGQIFSDTLKPLSINKCPPPKLLPSGITLDIRVKPSGDKLGSIYYDSSSDNTLILVTKDTSKLPHGLFRVTHRTTSDKEPFTLSKELRNGEAIKTPTVARQPIKNVTEVSVYYWNGNNNTPILIGIKQGSITKYYSKGNYWINAGNSNNSLVYLLDWRNFQRNGAIPVNLVNPKDSSQIYTDGKAPPFANITSSSPTLLPGTNYAIQKYIITGSGARISRVTFGKEDTDIILPTDLITGIGIYQWKDDPGGYSNSIPLLVEFIDKNNKSTFFENLTKESLTWLSISPDDSSKFYEKGTIQDGYTEELTKKLDEVSCRIHHTVKIDISKNKPNKYCHDRCKSRRIKVDREKGGGPFEGYTGYEYTSAIREQVTFTVTSIVNGAQHIQQVSGLPFRDIEKVTVYFPNCNEKVPVMIYIEYDKKTAWLKNKDGKGNWEEFDPGYRGGSIPVGEDGAAVIKAIKNILEVKGTLRLCQEQESQLLRTYSTTAAQGASEVPGLISGDQESENEDNSDLTKILQNISRGGFDIDDSQYLSLPTLRPSPRATEKSEPIAPQPATSARRAPSPNPGSTTDHAPYIIASSVLTASGSITGFALWIYQRFAGEPWVRQI